LAIVHSQMEGRDWTYCGRYVDKNNTTEVSKEYFEITCKACRSQFERKAEEEK